MRCTTLYNVSFFGSKKLIRFEDTAEKLDVDIRLIAKYMLWK